MQRGSDIQARPGSQPCRKRKNPSSLRGHSSTPSSKGYHLALPASMIVPKTQWNLGRNRTSGPVGHNVEFQIVRGASLRRKELRGSDDCDECAEQMPVK